MHPVQLAGRSTMYASRAAFLLRRALSGRASTSETKKTRQPRQQGQRNILFITSDQQRYDSLGVTHNPHARTPVLDGLARDGLLYRKAYVQNVVCMPARTTMLTGQHPLTHGVVANGICMPDDVPNVAEYLSGAGYHTALIGKAHFDPHLDPRLRFAENRLAAERSNGPWRGFDHVELATHGPIGGHHYSDWLWTHHPREVHGFSMVLAGLGGGETGAPEVKHNPIPREHYHTDWIADRALSWLRALDKSEPFFLWVSFPDPHHPFDPPYSEVQKRAPDFRDRRLPNGRPKSANEIRARLAQKPRHWLAWYEGRFSNPEGGPAGFCPERLTDDQLREIDATIQVENELIDEACGRLLSFLEASGLSQDTDVIFTSDHGDLQGDHGLLFKGPYHVDSLMHIPLVWRPAPCASIAPAVIDALVGHVDLATTFCSIAGVAPPAEMQGRALPTRREEKGHDTLVVSWDSQFAQAGMHMRTLLHGDTIFTEYAPSTRDAGRDFGVVWRIWSGGKPVPRYDGTEGELYDTADDPHQWHNRFDDPAHRRRREELRTYLRESMPPERAEPLPVAAPT
jgi:arylsulfatase A-like enzyme